MQKRIASIRGTLSPLIRYVWNGPFYVGQLTQPISLGSAFLKLLEVLWRFVVLAVTSAFIAWAIYTAWSAIISLLPPRDQEDCKLRLGEYGYNSDVRYSSATECERSFPASRLGGGKYGIYDDILGAPFVVSGPIPTERDYERYRDARSNIIKELSAQKRAEQELLDDKIRALSDFTVEKFDISCNIDSRYIACYDKNITVRVRNNSSKTISGLNFAYEIGSGISCSGSLGKKFSRDMVVRPHETGSFVENVKFENAGPNGVMTGCVKLDSVNKIE
jgi:hypothetical protein